MSANGVLAAVYLRVSRDDQTTENQRLVLEKVVEHRGWVIVQTYEDQGISGAKGRDQRPAFDTMLKDAVRRRFDVLMVWSIDRLGRSVSARGERPGRTRCCWRCLYSDQQAIDSTTPMGRAMIQMASVFGEQERGIRSGSSPARPWTPSGGSWAFAAVRQTGKVSNHRKHAKRP